MPKLNQFILFPSMNTLQINQIMTLNRVTNKFYRGCFPSNKIPLPRPSFPNSFIINTEPAEKEGAHWIAVFIPRPRVCYYFCSYALPPFGEIASYLRTNFGWIHRNKRAFQYANSKNCGKYCILFCYFLSIGWSFDNFLKFLSNIENTDHFVNNFVNKIIE